MKKQSEQQLVRIKTLMDSNDDDDMTSTASVENDSDSDQSSKITNLIRENERKIRNLSESYMNRFLIIGQQLQSSNAIALPSVTKESIQRKRFVSESETASSGPPLTMFVETLRQLIMKEERKREKTYLPPDDSITKTDPYSRISLGIIQCLRDYEGEISHAKQRIHDLNEQQEHILNENKNVVAQLTESFEQNTISLRQTYEKRLAKQREESLKVGQSLDNYKSEILSLREAYEKKLRVKDELITELNDRLSKNETEQAARQHALHLKIEHFQQSFETLQSRTKQIEQNHQIKAKENQDLLTQISNLHIQIKRLQQNVTSKANECTELSQKLAATVPKLTEFERFGSELRQWFLLISPENNLSDISLDDMSTIVSSKVSYFENIKKQLDVINEDLNNAHIYEGDHITDRVRSLITHNKQVEIAHNDITNKYQALLLQTNMLTGIIKQHSAEVANHKTNEEQLKEFNEQLLNENQKLKIEMQEHRSKLLHLTSKNDQLEHEMNLQKQHARDIQIQFETIRTENQMLNSDLHTKRDVVKHHEQELQSLKQLLEVTWKEKQIQSDQLKHERQLFQSENDTLKQLVIRDGHDKQLVGQVNLKMNMLSNQHAPQHVEKETIDDEIFRASNFHSNQKHRFVPANGNEMIIADDGALETMARRATSTPTPRDEESQPQSSSTFHTLGITKQIDQVLNDMKNLLTFGREVVDKTHDNLIPEREVKLRDKSKTRRSKKDRASLSSIGKN